MKKIEYKIFKNYFNDYKIVEINRSSYYESDITIRSRKELRRIIIALLKMLLGAKPITIDNQQ